MFSRWKTSQVIFTVWACLALLAVFLAPQFLQGSFPILTVLWIGVPLVVVWRTGDPGRAGFRAVPWRQLLPVTAINLAGALAVMLLFEPWSHTYQKLLGLVLASQTPDTTFAWLLRFPRVPALGAMALFSGFVTLFGEELFFRGWLLQLLQRRMAALWAVVVQALLFVLPNLLVAFAMPALQGWLYALVYTWFAIGMIGGWAAWRTGSIWPSLIAATLCNLILVTVIL